MAISFKGAHCPPEIMRMGVRWSRAYPFSSRPVEAVREERGVPIAPAPSQRWGVLSSPLWAAAWHRRKRPVGVSWRLALVRQRGAARSCPCSASSLPILGKGEQFPGIMCILALSRSHYNFSLYR